MASYTSRDASLALACPSTASPPLIRDRSRCANEYPCGSVRGAISNDGPYRDLSEAESRVDYQQWQDSRRTSSRASPGRWLVPDLIASPEQLLSKGRRAAIEMRESDCRQPLP
jgi:hypothetical protein